jgi:hypothetical protein
MDLLDYHDQQYGTWADQAEHDQQEDMPKAYNEYDY